MHSLQAARSKAVMVVKHWFTLEHSAYWCRRLDQVNAPAGDARYTLINAILAANTSRYMALASNRFKGFFRD